MTASNPPWDHETDVLVFGSGAGGLSAAIYGRKTGLDVLVCEKAATLGGTTASSGGIVWIPGNALAKAAGIEDSTEQARTYLRSELREYYRADLVEAFLEAGPKAIAALQENTEVAFQFAPFPDYHPDLPGGLPKGRSIEALRYDGRRLGKDFELVRPPLKRLMLLGGLSVDKRKVDDFLNPFRSVRGFLRVAGTLLRYAADRLGHSRGTDIGAGNALVARMLHSLRALKADIWVNAPLVELIREGERVVGAVVRHEGRTRRVRARRAVILATGGFPHDAALRKELGPRHPHDTSVANPDNVGEGIAAARRIGAAVDDKVVGPGYWTPTSLLEHKDGRRETILYGYLDRGRPGVIAVDASGRRFVNEANSYHDIGEALFRAGFGSGNHFWFICDRAFVWKRGMGLIRPFQPSLARYVRRNYISMADTLEDLARQIQVDPANLVETVRRHNEYCVTGIDPEFGKGGNAYNRMFGDAKVKPNPNLAPIVKPPFIALRIYPSTLGTTVGLHTNAQAQVLDASGEPIPGLYGCGNDITSVFRGFYPGGGATLGAVITFAFIAVRHIKSAAGGPPQHRRSHATPSPSPELT